MKTIPHNRRFKLFLSQLAIDSFLIPAMALVAILPTSVTAKPPKQDNNITVADMQNACSSLQNLQLVPPPGVALVQLESTEVRDVGLATEHCVVTVKIDSEISTTNIDNLGTSVFERARYFFPKVYNQRFRHTGGGGYDAGLQNTANPTLMQRGNAQGSMGVIVVNPTYNDQYYLFTNQNRDNEGLRILGRDGIYLSTIVGKQLLKNFYGKLPLYTYYHGGSRGGLQGIQAAVAHPEIFDGISVSTPAIGFTTIDTIFASQRMDLFAPELQQQGLLTKLEDEVLLRCDGLDGIVDSIIDFPSACKPDLESIYNSLALSPIARDIINDYLAGRTIIGNSGDPNLGVIAVEQSGFPITTSPLGDLLSIRNLISPAWYLVDGRYSSFPTFIGNTSAFTALFLGNAGLNLLPFDFNSTTYFDDVAESIAIPGDPTGHSIQKFAKGGGKMIVLGAWRDTLTSINQTTTWYEQQVKYFAGALQYGEVPPHRRDEKLNNGRAKLREAMRYFTLSSGGHVPDGIIDNVTMWNAVENWVERNQKPELLPASTNSTLYTRPACEYPKVAVRKDEAISFTDRNNWECLDQKKASKRVTPLNRADYTTYVDPVTACAAEPMVTDPGSGKKYKLCSVPKIVYQDISVVISTTNVDYNTAKNACIALGGYLVKIESQQENTFLTNTFIIANNLPQFASPWIGADDNAVEGVWKWVVDGSQFWQGNQSGSPVNGAYANWLTGQPNNLGGSENCASFRGAPTAGVWQDGPCGQAIHPFICEFDN